MKILKILINTNNSNLQITLIGESKVGKSCIKDLFIGNTSTEQYSSTHYVNRKYMNFIIENTSTTLLIYDYTGQICTTTSNLTNFLILSHGIIIVFDVTDYKSFKKVSSIIKQARKVPNHFACVLVRNKIDLTEQRQMSRYESEKFAIQQRIYYFETSAKNNENINELLIYIVTQAYHIGIKYNSFINW